MLDVYISEIRDTARLAADYPAERVEEIRGIGNPQTVAAKITSWNTLRHAISGSLHREMEEFVFRREDKGGWSAEGLYFSLTHTDRFAAAAISDAPVGVDLENLSDYLHKQENTRRSYSSIAQKICTPLELERCDSPSSFLLLWTRKEAIFKCSDQPFFSPLKTDTFSRPVFSFRSESVPSYLLSVCGSSSGPIVLHGCDEQSEKLLWIPCDP